MKRTIALMLASSILLTGCMATKSNYSDKMTTISIIDRNGMTEVVSSRDRLRRYENVNFLHPQPYQKVMRVYGRNECGDIKACMTSYHPNGQVKQYLEIINNRASGRYREWFACGKQKLEATVISGTADLDTAAENSWLFDGESIAWDEEGAIVAFIPYSKGVLNGDSLYYHPNGAIWKRVPFNNGSIDGNYEVFCADGTSFETIAFKQGKKQGEAIRYWPGELVAAKEHFEDDGLAEGSYYLRDGSTVGGISGGDGFRVLFAKAGVGEMHQYREGIQDGIVQVFDEAGVLFNTYCVKDDEKHGEEIEYFPLRPGQKKSIPSLSINWFKGQVQGKVRTWYSNGVMESQREISDNQKNGLATAWYEDGSLMLIEEYELELLKSGKYFKKGDKIPTSEVRDGKGIATLYDAVGNFLRKVDYLSGRPIL